MRGDKALRYVARAVLILGYFGAYLSGQPLDQIAVGRIWRPPGMT
ncbi:hypothetical protein ACIGXG_02865 [Streptomyces goshikiensis]